MFKKPLIITLGNDARGDDGFGFAIFNWLQQSRIANLADCQHLTQLQPEHIDLLRERADVLIVDCAHQQSELIELRKISPTFTAYFSSHIVPPDILLGWYQELVESPGPNCYLLTALGEEFDLGQSLSPAIQKALPVVQTLVARWIEQAQPTHAFV